MRVLAPAKLNLHLRVGPLRADGFHPIISWFCTIALFDTLTFAAAPPEPDDSSSNDGSRGVLSLETDRADLPTDGRNLIVKAAEALADTRGANPAGMRERVSAFLQKQIPAGGGLGGGSSDAAGTLVALNELWQLHRSQEELTALAAKLGSDVPFFLHGPSSVCRGRGEEVRPIGSPLPRGCVLVLPEIEMPTPAVYRKFDEMAVGVGPGAEVGGGNEPDFAAWSRLPAEALLANLVNDLEPPAFALKPELAELRARIEQLAGRPVRMSGSGSSLFTLFDTLDDAEVAAKKTSAETGVSARAVEVAPKL